MIWRETPQTNSMLRTWMSNALECATSHVVLRSTTVSRELIERELCEDLPFVAMLLLLIYFFSFIYTSFVWRVLLKFYCFYFLYSFYGLKFCYSKLTARMKEKKNRATLANECFFVSSPLMIWIQTQHLLFTMLVLLFAQPPNTASKKQSCTNERVLYIKPYFPSNSKNGTSYIKL